MNPSATQIVELLGLSPHSTCGQVRESFVSGVILHQSVLPAGYLGERHLGGVLYFLVTPAAPVRLHRIRSDQMYHFYLVDPLEVILLYPDGRNEVKTVGPDLLGGMRPQLLVPGGTFHAGRVRAGGAYTLLGTSVWLRAEQPDVEFGDAAALLAAYPAARPDLEAFAR
jgi:predicted cupin superfamily sugar epimerase